MKFVCAGIDLNDAIVKVSRALSTKSAEEILQGIKIEAYDNLITFFATDTEIAISKKIRAEVIEEGATVVSGKFILNFAKTLTNEQVEVTLSEKNRMRIRYKDSEVFVQCIDADNYPVFLNLEKPEKITIVQRELKEIVNRTSFCMSTDDSRPSLKGCLFEIEDYTLTAVTLDGARLMQVMKPIEVKKDRLKAIIPSRSFSEISKILDKDEDTVTLQFEKSFLLIDLGHTKVSIRLLGGEFINYKQIMPTTFATEMTAMRAHILLTLERAAALYKEDRENAVIKFILKENHAVLSCKSEIGNITENVNVAITGQDCEIAFKVKFLLDFIKNIDSEYLSFKFNSSVNPCVITPVTNSEKFLYLVLPVRTF